MFSSRIKHGHAISSLCLGTVQLGMPYGAANATGMPDEAQAVQLLRCAAQHGVTLLDTARAYGLSEQRIGAALPAGMTVITKCDPLYACGDHTPVRDIAAAVENSVQASCAALNLEVLPYVLLHRPEHLALAGGVVWRTLLAHAQVWRVGVSVASPQEALAAIAMPDISAMQLPFHILDGRWGEVARALKARPDMLVLARSSLLQGVLTLPPARWPVLAQGQAEALCGQLDAWAKAFGREGRVDLCLSYVRAQGWIDSIVLGMETVAQLEANVALFSRPPLDADACARIERERPALEDVFLNPANWPQKKETA